MHRFILHINRQLQVTGIWLAVFCLVGTAPAGAAEQLAELDLTSLSIEELMSIRVVSASKYEQTAAEAPSSVTVITADEIKHYGYRSLADVMRSIRGFSVSYDRVYSYLGVRGVGSIGDWNSHVLLLVNGHRINENVYDSAMLGNAFPLDVDLIARVEIIRGPGSSLYGDNAFFAVINVITRNGREMAGVELAADAGSLDTYGGRLSYGAKFENGLEMLISGSAMDSQGNNTLYFKEFDDPSSNNGMADNLDKDGSHRLFSRLIAGDFTLEGAYSVRSKQVPTASYGAVFNDPIYEDFEGRSYIDLEYKHSFADALQTRERFYYDWYWYHSDTPWREDGSVTTIINKDIGRARWLGVEAQIDKNIGRTHHLREQTY
ncbi:MAG: hypothetical protein A2511_16600 [Deltaproteobacteria bacterium RIFOXYD12_FULL_50_9]|nr:MAG: hypothetical protein A2511_16600 [Deltaproteobacteria bacterium RIFOXYD12_FULL_50_9]